MIRDIKIKKSYLLYFLIMLSFFHTTLRTEPEGFLSAYRITIPLIFLFLFLPKFKYFNKETILLLLIFVWNITTSYVFYNKLSSFMAFYLHILSIFSVYILIKVLKLRTENFSISFYRFLDLFTVVTMILFAFQYSLGFEFPNTVQGRLSLFYWSENELGMSLSIMVPLYIFKFMEDKRIFDLVKILAISLILYINDNKVCIIGVSVAFITYCLFIFIRKFREKRVYILIAFVIGVLFCVGLIAWNPSVQFRDNLIDVESYILAPISRIITLTPYHLAGSIYDRTDAIIYGLIELKRSYYLGIGLGNTHEMLNSDKYYLVTAKSMHNFIMQIIVEMGILGMFFFLKIVRGTFKGITQRRVRNIDIIRFLYLTSFIFISMQSSSGIFSNYFVWAVVIFIYLSEDMFIADNSCKAAQVS